VPGLTRAASAPGLAVAVACDRGQPSHDQKLYVVDLRQNTATAYTPPANLAAAVGVDTPAVSPDGTSVFTMNQAMNLCRFSLKEGKLSYEEAVLRGGGQRSLWMNDSPGVTISPDSKLVCLVTPNGHHTMTTVYPTDSLQRQHCTLDHGMERLYPGYRPM